MYIEDNASNVALIEDLLRDFEGTTLFTAPNAELGIALVLEHMPRLVIMDIHLPGMDGFEATARLKATPETRDIPVIALSAAPSSMASARAMQAGCYRYLSKPLNIVEFSKVLDRLLAPATSTDRPRARDDRRTE